MTTVVDLHDASAAVGGRAIWSGVDLIVGPGEFVALLGPNGVGKSTLLNVLLGLVPLAAGRARVLGDRPGRHNDRIGYVPQRRAFDTSTRIRGVDIVGLGLDGHRWGVPVPRWCAPARYRRRQRLVADVISLVGAVTYADRPIGECSGGEQQRLLIAQALVREPELLILDEPLDSLDAASQAGVTALLHDISRQRGVAVLLVAHDVNPVLPFLDRVAYLARGGLLSGTPDDVIDAETLTHLYGTPIDVLRDRTGRLVVVGQPDAPSAHADAGVA